MAKSLYKGWIDKVIAKKHSANSITFSHDNIYVVPSLRGLFFLLFALLNFIIGINYQNNLILGVAYLMLMLQISSLFYGYFNLHGLKLELLDVKNNYSGNHNDAKFKLSASKEVFSLSISNANWQSSGVLDKNIFESTSSLVVNLSLEKRGKYTGGKFKIHSCYPFGLVNVWSYLLSDKTFYVYPTPLKCELDLRESIDSDDDTDVIAQKSDSLDEFSGLKPYQQGMNRNRISWRHFAKNQELLVKDYVGDSHGITLVLDFSMIEGTKETRLSKLCHQVLEADRLGHEFALKLPGNHIPAASGERHAVQCLESLSEC
ncbi:MULTISPECIES: DUF58 domain-containing protein [Pseudoalteromonas]|uniref:Repeat domain protein n=1 Tax=Pseudoalteromonas luteoviolacea (strain 2ta16) TaxID=1353533 RepID=V4HRH1_PSEL2|nr:MULTISPECIES: DUF58 domain-containing protein [Pseudoalteromonas]ESP93410.1 repeat domain protein [Pseudoalteromonas luteoviolacea 2ta16]KZN43885.1 hypothetical protein N483_08165 [Pseudoalteromonas luteoviolacea NCIMB 1944]MCG7549176.1 DUF58 domain-containing protein [Pseudoalteromonas sp. Of7M-16]